MTCGRRRRRCGRPSPAAGRALKDSCLGRSRGERGEHSGSMMQWITTGACGLGLDFAPGACAITYRLEQQMKPSAFGFAKPIKIDDIGPGMLIAATSADGERMIGVGYHGDYDAGLVVVWSSRDTDIPRVEDLDARFVYASIDGALEVEPEDVQDAFSVLPKLKSETGLTLNAEGRIGAAVAVDQFGTLTRDHVDLETGKSMERSAGTGLLSGYRMFIRQEGRKDRWPLIELS